jgi:hypothetical protein
VSDRFGSHQSIQGLPAKDLSLRLSATFSFEGYFYFTYYLSIGPMLDAGEV